MNVLSAPRVKATSRFPQPRSSRPRIHNTSPRWDFPRLVRRLGVGAFSFGALCWLLLWVGINTGPWTLRLDLIESSWTGFFNGTRAALPLVVLAFWIFHLASRPQGRLRSFTLPEALWFYYGLVMLAASVYADPWFDCAYWGFAYLSVFAATEIYMRESSSYKRASDLNLLNWLFGSAVLITLVWIARGQLLAPTSMGVSGYGVLGRIPTVAGMPMVRASGISRLAAVPAIVAFPLIWHGRGPIRIFSATAFVLSAYLVWVMQSRGSLVSFGLALSFVMALLGGTARRVSIVLLTLLATIFMLGFMSNDTVHNLWLFATRGTEGQQLASMSGRTRIFHDAWEAIKTAPFIGYGPQADRQLPMVGNAQNGALYALLCAGFLGGSGYIAGLIASWLMLFQVARHRHLLEPAERITFVQIAGMMAFFTIRSYPENCAALFSVDLLLQLPAIVYIGEFDRRLKSAIVARQVVCSSGVRPIFALPSSVHINN
jgi:O-antigen ligase